MTESAKERFGSRLDQQLDSANAASGAFGKIYEQNKQQWIERQKLEMFNRKEIATETTDTELAQRFNSEVWDKQKGTLKSKAMAAYEGTPDKEAITQHTEGMVNGLGTAAVAGLINSGDIMGGIGHHARHSMLGMLSGIPFIGQFISQVLSFIGGNVSAMFGGGDWVGWSESGEKVRNTKAKERLSAAFGQSVDMKQIGEMVDESSREPAPPAAITPPASNQRPASSVEVPADARPPQVTGGQHLDDGTPVVPNGGSGGAAATPAR